jgi:hypothetical protein
MNTDNEHIVHPTIRTYTGNYTFADIEDIATDWTKIWYDSKCSIINETPFYKKYLKP